MERFEVNRTYKGYKISGSAVSVHNFSKLWFATGSVTVRHPDNSVTEVNRYRDSVFTYDDESLAAWFGLALAEIAVDHFVPPPIYYLTPMNLAWAVDILRRGAEDCNVREIRRPKLYEAISFLEDYIRMKNWLVRRYTQALLMPRDTYREKQKMREALRVAARGIQQACAARLVDRMNELSQRYRENKPKIDNLQQVLEIVRRPVRP